MKNSNITRYYSDVKFILLAFGIIGIYPLIYTFVALANGSIARVAQILIILWIVYFICLFISSRGTYIYIDKFEGTIGAVNALVSTKKMNLKLAKRVRLRGMYGGLFHLFEIQFQDASGLTQTLGYATKESLGEGCQRFLNDIRDINSDIVFDV